MVILQIVFLKVSLFFYNSFSLPCVTRTARFRVNRDEFISMALLCILQSTPIAHLRIARSFSDSNFLQIEITTIPFTNIVPYSTACEIYLQSTTFSQSKQETIQTKADLLTDFKSLRREFATVLRSIYSVILPQAIYTIFWERCKYIIYKFAVYTDKK